MSDISQRLRSSKLGQDISEGPIIDSKQELIANRKRQSRPCKRPRPLSSSTISQVNVKRHVKDCRRAMLQYSNGRERLAYNLIKKVIKDNFVCLVCLELLFHIIQQRIPNIQSYNGIIKKCLEVRNLPKEAKEKLQKFQQLIQKEQSKTNNNEMSQQEQDKVQDQNPYGYIKMYEKRGAKFQKVQIKQISRDYRIAVAKSDIDPFEDFIKIPEKFMITLEVAKKSPQIMKIFENQQTLRSPRHCMLSVFLLLQKSKGINSIYYDYLLSFPLHLQTFPIYYQEEEINCLEGTTFLNALRRKNRELKEDYRKILKILPQIQQYTTFQTFVWARMIVSSRIFGIFYNGVKTDALVPVADMLNHKSPKMTTWFYCEKQKCFIIQNCENMITKGQQIFDSYGSKCNSRFLLNYGFTMQNNPLNQVGVVLKRYKDHTITTGVRISASLNCDEFKMILGYYRYYAAHIDIQSQSQQSQSDNCSKTITQKQRSGFISKQNQCEVWKLIKQSMKLRLEEYKTTVREDQKILNKKYGDLTFNLRNCVRIRLGQKKVLHFYIDMANAMIQYFQKGTKIKNRKLYEEYLKDINF